MAASGGRYSGSITASSSSSVNVWVNGVQASGCVADWNSTGVEYGNGIYGASHTHPLCDTVGHKLDKTLIEYYDGTAMGQCVECHEKINFVPPPGGTTVLRLHKALQIIANGGDFTNEWLEVFRDVHDKLKEEAQALRAAEALLDAANAYMAERFGVGD